MQKTTLINKRPAKKANKTGKTDKGNIGMDRSTAAPKAKYEISMDDMESLRGY